MVMRGITNRAILGVISGLSRVSIPEIVAEILKTLNCLLLQQDCAQQFQCVSIRSNIVPNGLEPLSGPFFLLVVQPQPQYIDMCLVFIYCLFYVEKLLIFCFSQLPQHFKCLNSNIVSNVKIKEGNIAEYITASIKCSQNCECCDWSVPVYYISIKQGCMQRMLRVEYFC